MCHNIIKNVSGIWVAEEKKKPLHETSTRRQKKLMAIKTAAVLQKKNKEVSHQLLPWGVSLNDESMNGEGPWEQLDAYLLDPLVQINIQIHITKYWYL